MNLLKKKCFFTVLIVPHSKDAIHSFSLSNLLMQFVCLVLLAATIFGALIIRNYKIAGNRLIIMGEIESENQELKESMEQLILETEELKLQLAEMTILSGEIKLLAESTSLGQGGGDSQLFFNRQNYYKSLDGRGNMSLDRAYRNISLLQESIPEKNAMMVQLKDELQEYQNELSCTPSIWPVKGKISSRFGIRRSPFTGRKEMHYGLDIAASRGTEIFAAADGKVVQATYLRGMGYMIALDHGYGLETRYAHLSKFAISKGEHVQKGQVIGYVGSTGRSTGPHLHYEVRLNGVAVDPEAYLGNNSKRVD